MDKVNQYDPVAASAIIQGGERQAEMANAAYDAANPRPKDPVAFKAWFAGRNAYRKKEVESFLDVQSVGYNKANPGGFGSMDAKGNFILDPSNPQNEFLPGGKYQEIGEAERQDALRRLRAGGYPDIVGREREYAMTSRAAAPITFQTPESMTGPAILGTAPKKSFLDQVLEALFGTNKQPTNTKIMNIKPYAILMVSALLFSACASPLSPIIETQKEQTIGYRVTAPEVKDPVNNTVLPAVDYTLPVVDLANPEPPKEIPEGATVEPVKVLTRVSVVNPQWQAGIDTVKTANGLLNPTPTAPLVGIGLTLFGYVLSGIAALRNKQTGKALESVQGALHAAVDGIEKASAAGMLAKEAKGVIQAKAIATGAQQVLAAVVASRTK